MRVRFSVAHLGAVSCGQLLPFRFQDPPVFSESYTSPSYTDGSGYLVSFANSTGRQYLDPASVGKYDSKTEVLGSRADIRANPLTGTLTRYPLLYTTTKPICEGLAIDMGIIADMVSECALV